jgi:predicted Zn-dependent protease
MKKWIVFLMAFIIAGGSASPQPLFAAESYTNFRQRASVGDEILTSDIAEEIRFGREVAARIIARFGMYDNPEIMKYVNLVGNVLAINAGRPELEFHFAVLNTDEINGYAAPGGYIFLTRGAIANMQDESELAGALAHEIGHVVEKHAVKELNIKGQEKTSVSNLAMLIGGSSDSARVAFSQAVDKALDLLFKDGYKRADEIQADRDAVLFCALSGYAPIGLSRYFARIDKVKGKQTEIIDKTHPSFKDRIAWMGGMIKEEGIDTGDYKTAKDRFAKYITLLK